MKNKHVKRDLLPLHKGEIKEGVGALYILTNHPLNSLLHEREQS